MFENERGISVERYTPERKESWDRFVDTGKNATFLHLRDYMDYHSDRFSDHSLLLTRNDRLLALLPGNITDEGTLISHQGLTFGGFVFRQDVTLCEVLESFHAALECLHLNQVQRLIYKRIPRFYNVLPDDEVDYALFLLEARLRRRDCALVVSQQDRLPLRKGRKSEISKARRYGVRVVEETDFAAFWEELLAPRLASRYGVKPVHSVAEITLLASRFPTHIRQFSAYCGDRIVAGATIYETPTVAHAQYSAVSDEGRKIGALDLLFGWLITERYEDKRYFDFGICNEREGRVVNHGLAVWKEGFGGRSAAHDFYEVLPRSYPRLESVLPAPSVRVGAATQKPG
jgi:hypothetical protein